MCRAALLSHHKDASEVKYISKSLNRYEIYLSSVVARLLYSASVDDLYTIGCFLLFYDTSESPKKMQYPVIDRCVCASAPICITIGVDHCIWSNCINQSLHASSL